MNNRKTKKFGRANLEGLEQRRLLSAAALQGSLMVLSGDANQANTFLVCAATQQRVQGVADNNAYTASTPTLKGVVIHTGNETDTVTVGPTISLSVEVISPAGQITWMTPGTTETFDPSSDPPAPVAPDPTPTSRLTPTVTVTDAGGIYNGSAVAASGSVTGANNANLGTPTFTYYRASDTALASALSSAPSDVGVYVVVASYAGGADYTAASASASFSITAATPTLTFTDAGGAYNGSAFAASGSVTGVNNANLGTPTFTYYLASDTALANPLSGAPGEVGSYVVVASYAGSADYTTASESTSFSITAATPPAAITVTSNTTVLPEESVNVQALASSFGNGTVLNSTISWNFGDPTGAYNNLVGFNAAHAYATPGVYTITLSITTPDGQVGTATQSITVVPDTRKTIYVATDGNDSNDGSSAADPIQSIARLNQILTSNTRVLFECGDTFDTTGGIGLTRDQNVYIGSYGQGAQPVLMYDGPYHGGALIAMNDASDIAIQGLTFDSIYTAAICELDIPNGIDLSGNDITILNNTYMNVDTDNMLNAQPTNVLIQNNTSPSTTALKSYFAWVQGSDIVIVGNTVANSDGESIMRVGGANDILFAYNTLHDEGKDTITIQNGSYAYVYDNTVSDAGMGVGPLLLPDENPVTWGFNYCVFDSNTLNDTALDVSRAAHHVMLKNNVLLNSSITINGTWDALQATDIYILNNTVDYNVASTEQWGRFLTINQGEAAGVVVDNNLFVDPADQTGAGQGIIVDSNNDLDSFTQVQDNVWAIPTPSGWAQGGYFYVNANPGVRAGYLTPAEWEATPLANGDYPTADVYINECLGSTYAVSTDGFTAGSDLPTD